MIKLIWESSLRGMAGMVNTVLVAPITKIITCFLYN